MVPRCPGTEAIGLWDFTVGVAHVFQTRESAFPCNDALRRNYHEDEQQQNLSVLLDEIDTW